MKNILFILKAAPFILATLFLCHVINYDVKFSLFHEINIKQHNRRIVLKETVPFRLVYGREYKTKFFPLKKGELVEINFKLKKMHDAYYADYPSNYPVLHGGIALTNGKRITEKFADVSGRYGGIGPLRHAPAANGKYNMRITVFPEATYANNAILHRSNIVIEARTTSKKQKKRPFLARIDLNPFGIAFLVLILGFQYRRARRGESGG